MLEKGLKFTPIPNHANTQELAKDISEFTRKVRLVEFFEGIDDNDKSLVRNKTNFVPPKGRDQLLDNFVESTINIPLETQDKSKIKRNISFSEQKAISSLANDTSIIIKQADKGGATVIMDRSFYQKQIEKILLNTEYYSKLDHNPHKEIMKKYRSILKKQKQNLQKKNLIISQTLNVNLVISMACQKFTRIKQ